MTLADIVNDSGTHIEPWALSGSNVAKVQLHLPNQAKPPERSWVLWHRFLKKAFIMSAPKSHRLNKVMLLDRLLGEWSMTKPYTARKYLYYPG
eukprot:1208602-Ditylum_brightwellii.AAC.1